MKKEIETYDAYQETFTKLKEPGLLLMAGVDYSNPMTIGWAVIGRIWRKPILQVLVRPSQFTFHLMEEYNNFTVNVPTDDMNKIVGICGTKSGRDINKIKECNLTLEKGIKVDVPSIKECHIHYECRTVHKNIVLPAQIDSAIKNNYYSEDDYHTIYFGEIVGVFKIK